MKKLLTLIKTKGKTRAQVVMEMKKILEEKGLLTEDGKLNLPLEGEPNSEHEKQ